MSYKSPKWNNGSAPPLSAENLQDLTDAVQEQGEALETMYNPNLLDNWYFGNPVNQRGQTSYTGAGYTIDRWLVQTPWGTSIETVTVEGGCVKLASGTMPSYPTSYGKWQQIIEDKAALVGKVVTAAIFVESVVPGNGSGVAFGFGNSGDLIAGMEVNIPTPGVYAKTITWTEDLDRIYVRVGRDTTTPAKATIKAIKLELGSQQTLAHQKDGVWVLNEIPRFSDQLAACQRYLIPINNWTRVRASYYSANALYFTVPIPSTMRTTPAILDPSGALTVLRVSGSNPDISFTFDCNMSTPGSISVQAMKDSHGLTDGQLIKRGGGSFQTVFFSSEL